MKYSKVRVAIAFLLSAILAFILASISHSQFVLKGLSDVGIDIPLSVRLEMTINDVIGLSSGYGPIVLIGMSVGFSIIGLLRRYFDWSASQAFAIGGALSFAAIHWLMYPIFFITLIAGARGFWGFSMQCLSGLIGGFIFARTLRWTKCRDTSLDR